MSEEKTDNLSEDKIDPKLTEEEKQEAQLEQSKKAEAKKKLVTVVWAVNVKYRGNRYSAGEKTDIFPEDRKALIASGVVRTGD